MKAARLAAAALLLITAIPSVAWGSDRRDIEIAAGPLDIAIARLAQLTGVDIGTTDPAVALARSPAVHGRLSPHAALGRMLQGTGYRAVRIDPTSFRIERAPVRARAKPRPIQSAPETEPAAETILVVASKRDAPLLRYPGSIAVIQPKAGDMLGAGDRRDVHSIADSLPILQSTELGSGRNKLFIRGIADSSFVGPTRSTASVYLGETQLGYNGADPNLNLYDVQRIEILEGPQGALYGAGSIGGIVRIVPHDPALDRIAAGVLASASATQDGANGHELAAMVNVPLVNDMIAIRLVGYQTRDGGFIDDSKRALRNINRQRTRGGRAALRFAPGDGWTIDLGAVAQENKAIDSQYTMRGMPALTRASTIAQPFEGDFSLGQIVIRKSWDSGLQLVSATAKVRHHSDDRFDATSLRPTTPLAYDSHDRNRMTTHETRLSRSLSNGNSWLIGVGYIDDDDRIERELGQPGRPQDITGVTNRARDTSIFGEVTIALTPALSIAGGGRLTRTRTDSDPTFVRRGTAFIRGRKSIRYSPMAAASYALSPRFALFARYGSGFRTGGLAVAPGIGRVANFTPDSIRVAEAGLRLDRDGVTGLSATATLSYARWKQIQADLVDRFGFPYSTNIGNGRIRGFEATADWVPMRGLNLGGSIFLNHSSLHDPILALTPQKGDELADTPRANGSARASYQWGDPSTSQWHVRGTAAYVGRSYVGFGPMLNIMQGNYATFGAGAGWQRGKLSVMLDIDNIANSHANRFSLGNPFGVGNRNQMTPLRPRTAKLTVARDF
ncbi:TonB-dependent receptor domain-containing protein [Sphingomonas montanisoli]|uniref:TonB-dependent receptor n=1 Tax=Sphingomonas montanisoli TaxID=2606412 RepID=A0A5D9CHG4_9SPHN|nr:TonB-dependent receptor [Sphingomonas montanisoli]TZG29561.1 TonB-dependent receptor [Sphingomonas montanisoli]